MTVSIPFPHLIGIYTSYKNIHQAIPGYIAKSDSLVTAEVDGLIPAKLPNAIIQPDLDSSFTSNDQIQVAIVIQVGQIDSFRQTVTEYLAAFAEIARAIV